MNLGEARQDISNNYVIECFHEWNTSDRNRLVIVNDHTDHRHSTCKWKFAPSSQTRIRRTSTLHTFTVQRPRVIWLSSPQSDRFQRCKIGEWELPVSHTLVDSFLSSQRGGASARVLHTCVKEYILSDSISYRIWRTKTRNAAQIFRWSSSLASKYMRS